MNSGQTLLFSVVLVLLIGIIFQIVLFQNKKKQKREYPKLWKEFEVYKKQKAHNELITVGNKLIFNKYLSQEHLTVILKTAVELEERFPEFESLRLNAYNKQLHYNRTIPEAWSSGGIEQTWFGKK